MAAKGASLDLHSAAAWENIFILKDIIESSGVEGKPETVDADRRKIRDGLAALTEVDGLLGMNKRMPDGEAVKPYVFVHAKDANWAVLHEPGS